MDLRVALLFRKKLSQFNSIEELFYAIKRENDKKVQHHVIEMPEAGAGPKSLLKNIVFTFKKRGKLNHITGHVNYLALVTGKNTILTVHDIGSTLYGNILHRFFIKLFWFWIPAILVRRITVISEFSKKELEGLIPFSKNKILVIPNPVKEELIFKPKTFNTVDPLILCIGTKSNKNLERSIEALKDIPCRLLIIGKLTEQQIHLLKKNRINYISKYYIAFEEIIKAYQECDLVCFASIYEGFGMPIIEGQATGRPVLTSNLEPMKEVAGNGACLVDPYDVAAIREGIKKIIHNDLYREKLIEEGLKNVQRFQIDKIADQYLQLYKELRS